MNGRHNYQFRPDVYSANPKGGLLYHGLSEQQMGNLNTLRIATDGEPRPLADHSGTFHPPKIAVHFRDIADRLAEYIAGADVVLGCVAWLTHHDILERLGSVPHGVQLVVQKEDFLRPDNEDNFMRVRGFNKSLRQRYDALPAITSQYALPGVAGSLNMCCEYVVQPVRCVGNHNSTRSPVHPRMHNKFMVFCRYDESRECDAITPYAVWTGSFNVSRNATNSFENAVYIECDKTAGAYADEWAQIYALSEPLNWESDWVAPEFRIGT